MIPEHADSQRTVFDHTLNVLYQAYFTNENIVLAPIPLFLSFQCLYSGSQASPQDRFLVMAAEMDNSGTQELAQFWKEVARTKVMEHRYENM